MINPEKKLGNEYILVKKESKGESFLGENEVSGSKKNIFLKMESGDHTEFFTKLEKGGVITFSKPLIQVKKGEIVGYVKEPPASLIQKWLAPYPDKIKSTYKRGHLHWEIFSVNSLDDFKNLFEMLEVKIKDFNENDDENDNFITKEELKGLLDKVATNKAEDKMKIPESEKLNDYRINLWEYMNSRVDFSGSLENVFFQYLVQTFEKLIYQRDYNENEILKEINTKFPFHYPLSVDITFDPKWKSLLNKQVHTIIVTIIKLDNNKELAEIKLNPNEALEKTSKKNSKEKKMVVTCILNIPAETKTIIMSCKSLHLLTVQTISQEAGHLGNFLKYKWRNLLLTQNNEWSEQGLNTFINKVKTLNQNAKALYENFENEKEKLMEMIWWEKTGEKGETDYYGDTIFNKLDLLPGGDKKIHKVHPVSFMWVVHHLINQKQLTLTAETESTGEFELKYAGWAPLEEGIYQWERKNEVLFGSPVGILAVIDQEYSSPVTIAAKNSDTEITLFETKLKKGLSITKEQFPFWGEWELKVLIDNNETEGGEWFNKTLKGSKPSIKEPIILTEDDNLEYRLTIDMTSNNTACLEGVVIAKETDGDKEIGLIVREKVTTFDSIFKMDTFKEFYTGVKSEGDEEKAMFRAFKFREYKECFDCLKIDKILAEQLYMAISVSGIPCTITMVDYKQNKIIVAPMEPTEYTGYVLINELRKNDVFMYDDKEKKFTVTLSSEKDDFIYGPDDDFFIPQLNYSEIKKAYLKIDSTLHKILNDFRKDLGNCGITLTGLAKNGNEVVFRAFSKTYAKEHHKKISELRATDKYKDFIHIVQDTDTFRIITKVKENATINDYSTYESKGVFTQSLSRDDFLKVMDGITLHKTLYDLIKTVRLRAGKNTTISLLFLSANGKSITFTGTSSSKNTILKSFYDNVKKLEFALKDNTLEFVSSDPSSKVLISVKKGSPLDNVIDSNECKIINEDGEQITKKFQLHKEIVAGIDNFRSKSPALDLTYVDYSGLYARVQLHPASYSKANINIFKKSVNTYCKENQNKNLTVEAFEKAGTFELALKAKKETHSQSTFFKVINFQGAELFSELLDAVENKDSINISLEFLCNNGGQYYYNSDLYSVKNKIITPAEGIGFPADMRFDLNYIREIVHPKFKIIQGLVNGNNLHVIVPIPELMKDKIGNGTNEKEHELSAVLTYKRNDNDKEELVSLTYDEANSRLTGKIGLLVGSSQKYYQRIRNRSEKGVIDVKIKVEGVYDYVPFKFESEKETSLWARPEISIYEKDVFDKLPDIEKAEIRKNISLQSSFFPDFIKNKENINEAFETVYLNTILREIFTDTYCFLFYIVRAWPSGKDLVLSLYDENKSPYNGLVKYIKYSCQKKWSNGTPIARPGAYEIVEVAIPLEQEEEKNQDEKKTAKLVKPQKSPGLIKGKTYYASLKRPDIKESKKIYGLDFDDNLIKISPAGNGGEWKASIQKPKTEPK
ncbi:MAG: hypothetical protein JXJ04_24075 [Spirochaetales bacterium]|nr:hypothetical protein [Spirochaetales bacterium]